MVGLALLIGILLGQLTWGGGFSAAEETIAAPAPVIGPATSTPVPLDLSGFLIFEVHYGENSDIFRVYPDGSGLKNLTNHPASETDARLSPDRSTLALVSIRGGSPEIYLTSLNGGPLRAMTAGGQGDPGWSEIAWSPDGGALAAVRAVKRNQSGFTIQRGDPVEGSRAYDGTNEGTLAVIRLNDTLPVQVSEPDQVAWSPQWSPDGQRIYFNVAENGYGRIYSVR